MRQFLRRDKGKKLTVRVTGEPKRPARRVRWPCRQGENVYDQRSEQIPLSRNPHHWRRRGGRRLGRNQHHSRRVRVSHHVLDDDGHGLRNRKCPTGNKNLWGDTLTFVQPESEHSAATTCEGFALAGGRVTNFTSGQGLVLMKEVLYTISGKRLPIVFHIGARALTSHSLNVHCGHDDVMSVSGLRLGNFVRPQRAGSLRPGAPLPRRAAEAVETPFMNVQDGFSPRTPLRTSSCPNWSSSRNTSAIRIRSSAACSIR
mgnify:CR=1 FL=1